MLHVDHVRPRDPALVPLHGGLRRAHVPPGQRGGQVDLRQVPLEAQAGPAVGGLERGGQDQRRRSGLPPPRPVGRHPAGRLPGVGAGPAAVRRGVRRPVRLRRARRRPSSSRRSWCRSAAVGRMVLDRWPDNFFAETEQVAFCTPEHRARHRLHQRPAAAGPQLLLPRHAAQAAGQPELHAAPDQRAQVPVRHTSSRTGTWRWPTRRPGELRAELLASRRGRPTGRPGRGFRSYPSAGGGARSGGCAPRASPTTTARRASSTSARPRSSNSTSPPRSPSS